VNRHSRILEEIRHVLQLGPEWLRRGRMSPSIRWWPDEGPGAAAAGVRAPLPHRPGGREAGAEAQPPPDPGAGNLYLPRRPNFGP
jgi:hypothetical protein